MLNKLPISIETVRRGFSRWDFFKVLLVVGVVIFFAEASRDLLQPLSELRSTPLSLDPINLPEYAARTVLRMMVALTLSLLFTFTYATLAAKNKRAELLLIPMLDILQSVPILGFISVTVVFFMALAPGRVLGAEFASIFAIFTSQAWNMAFSFYQSLRTVPTELVEASHLFRLSPWMRFWRLEVPFAMPQLVWNMMMSMSGSWFFVVASEAISVGNTVVTLPGIVSYIALAIEQRNLQAVGFAIGAMLVVILIYDALLFRPLVAWADRFRFEQEPGVSPPKSSVLMVLRRSRLIALIGRALSSVWRRTFSSRLFGSSKGKVRPVGRKGWADRVWGIAGVAVVLLTLWQIGRFLAHGVSFTDIGRVFRLGLATLARVIILIAVASLIWVPAGVWVGTRPHAVRVVQPIAQFLAAFPANLLFPIFVSAIVAFKLNPDIWLSPLMILGTQWYILFNVDRRRCRDPFRAPRRRNEPAGHGLALVAEDRPSRRVSVLRHGRRHGVRRLLEREHRRRGGDLGRSADRGPRARRLHRAGDRGRRLSSHRARDRGHEPVRRGPQSGVLASALLAGGTEVPPGLTGEFHECGPSARDACGPAGLPEARWG
jgi:NitT/TauT family transport system permease protein